MTGVYALLWSSWPLSYATSRSYSYSSSRRLLRYSSDLYSNCLLSWRNYLSSISFSRAYLELLLTNSVSNCLSLRSSSLRLLNRRFSSCNLAMSSLKLVMCRLSRSISNESGAARCTTMLCCSDCLFRVRLIAEFAHCYFEPAAILFFCLSPWGYRGGRYTLVVWSHATCWDERSAFVVPQ